MKKPGSRSLFLLCALSALPLFSMAQVPFDDFFLDQALRIDLYQSGDAKEETITIHQIYQEGTWPEPKTVLIPPFDYGRYVYKLYDVSSNRLIFCPGVVQMVP